VSMKIRCLPETSSIGIHRVGTLPISHHHIQTLSECAVEPCQVSTVDDFVSYTSRRYNLYAKVLPLKIYEQLSFKNSLDALLDTNSIGLQ